MKTLLSAGFLLCAGIGYSQQTEPTPVEQGATPIRAEYKGATHTEAKQSKAITISKKAGEPQRVHDVAYYNEEIAKVDAHITAIDAKIGHVNADPAEKALAEQNGWFQEMDQIKQELNQRRATLVLKRDNL